MGDYLQIFRYFLTHDDANIADYAKEALERFFAAGIIGGYPGVSH